MLSQNYRDQTKKNKGHKRGKPENMIKVVNRTGNGQKVERREREDAEIKNEIQ